MVRIIFLKADPDFAENCVRELVQADTDTGRRPVSVSAVLLDLFMPESNGFAAFAMRRNHPQARHAGFDGYLTTLRGFC